MSRWIRRLLIGLAGLVALAVAVLAWLLATFDPNRYQGLLVDWMRDNHQRTLSIGEPIVLKVWPRLRLQLGGVTLSEHQRPETFATLASAELVVNWLPLLRRELVIDQVGARGVQLTWRRDAQGRSNLDDFLTPTPDKAAAPSPTDGLRFDLGGARLEAVQLSVDDALAGVSGVLEVASLQVGRFAPGQTTPVTLDLRARLAKPVVEARLAGRLDLGADLAARRWTAGAIDLTLDGDLPGASGLHLVLSGAVEADLARQRYAAQPIKLNVDGNAGGLQLKGSTLQAATLAWNGSDQSIDVKDLDVAVTGSQAGAATALTLQWPSLAVRGSSLQGSALKGRFERGGPMALKGEFATGTPAGSFEQLRIPGFTLKVQGSGTRELQAELSADLQVEPQAQRAQVNRLGLQASLKEPGLQPLSIVGTGSAQGSAKAAGFELKGRFNQDPFEARVQADLGGKVPQIEARARFDALDLDRLLPKSTAGAAGAASAPAGGGGDPAVDLAALRSVDARFDLAIGNLQRAPFRIGDLKAVGRLDGGALALSTFSGRIWGGRFDTAATAEARAGAPQRLALKGSVEEIDIQAALKDVLGRDDVEGRGRVAFDLAAGGASVAALKSSLDGSAQLRLRDGALRGFNIARSLRQARAALTLQQDAVQRAKATEKTDFSELTASFALADGVATSRDLDAKSPLLRLGGEGRIDLPREQIDYTVRATVASTLKGQDGADLEALRGVTVPVRLAGPFTAVDWQVQWSQVASAVLKDKAQEKVDAARGKLEAKVTDKLREKLGLPAAASGADAASAPSLKDQVQEQAKDKLKDKLKGLFR